MDTPPPPITSGKLVAGSWVPSFKSLFVLAVGFALKDILLRRANAGVAGRPIIFIAKIDQSVSCFMEKGLSVVPFRTEMSARRAVPKIGGMQYCIYVAEGDFRGGQRVDNSTVT